MSVTIKLYKDFTPNREISTHYVYDNVNDLDTYLATTTNLVDTISIDNYLFNTNVIIVNITSSFTQNKAKSITYLSIKDGSETPRYYYIDNIIIQSGYVEYNISQDYWANYIATAKFDHTFVQKCNRDIGHGVYPEIKHNVITENTFDEIPLYNYTPSPWVVFSVSYRTSTGSALLFKTSSIGLFAVNIDTLFSQSTWSSLTKNTIELSNIISNISYLFTEDDGNRAQVEEIYILPEEMFDHELTATTLLTNYLKSGASLNPISAYRVLPNYVIKSFQLNHPTIKTYLNYDLYFGVRNNGLKLLRTTYNQQLHVKFITSNQDVHVIVNQGSRSKDITDSFKLFSVQSDNINSGLSKLTNIISSGIQIGVGTALQSPMMLTRGLSNAIGTSLHEDANPSFSNQSGNASVTWGNMFNTIPFRYTRYPSLHDEQELARKEGIYFNEYVNFLSIPSYLFVGTGADNDDTYVQCTTGLEGVPTEAYNKIINDLNNGCYIQYI